MKKRCDECEATFKQQKNIKVHKDAIHLNKLSFSCMMCDKKFRRNTQLKRHVQLIHENTLKKTGRPLKDEKDLSAKQLKRRDQKQVAIIEKNCQIHHL